MAADGQERVHNSQWGNTSKQPMGNTSNQRDSPSEALSVLQQLRAASLGP
jgi:hypothetical protein